MKHGARIVRRGRYRRRTLADFIRKILWSIFTLWFLSSLWKHFSSSRSHGLRRLGTVDVVFGTHQDKKKRKTSDNVSIVSEGNVGVVCTTQSHNDLTQWLTYHRSIGVHHFFIFLDGNSTPMNAEAERMYKHMPDVTVYTSTQTNEWRNESKILNLKRMRKHIHEPVCGVDRVFVQQALNVEYVIHQMFQGNTDANIAWIVHIDSDELIYPDGAENTFNVRRLLARIPNDVGRVIFPNYEAVPEKLNNRDPFIDVTLFRRSHKHLDAEVYAKYKDASKGDNPRYFLGYSNGKSAARVFDDLLPVGVHNFEHIRSKHLKEITLNESVILHYGFTDFLRVVGRFSQCDCPKEFTHKCKRLEFDLELARKYHELYLTSREEELQTW
eukprot:CAMPEP_0179713842 /NCGR_PEP_ID=MMETSP0938-20121108/531_1 /TAXON_ID=548131 ORGANISM="Ostreococcus mediterraneus, Strain clade-D-RCC1107" /NCGR_SAMPLE_ID=MMETSP0938 /ASSEMBLY_ACC=CAM_ASM_000576 /LENGTH=382 /DNA_ID=CAMNT_0021587485 /DNA_START=3379 /DNA_END=4524 /DNA_ORIENTATION=+